jgi:hypothetical protein
MPRAGLAALRSSLPAMTTPLSPGFAALEDCQTALDALEARCCEPGRSPRMRAIAETLAQARSGMERIDQDPAAAEVTLAHLEDIGAQVGRLQVGCCAPNRLPLYADMLEGLTTAQLAVNRSLGRGH